MSKAEVLILAVTVQGLSVREAARIHGVSKSLVHKLHQRWLTEGEAAFAPRSRAPGSSPRRTPDAVRARVLQLRAQLTADGLDAGADTIASALTAEGTPLSRSTIWRILRGAAVITPQPQKRPRSSWQRFTAERPNELWQSDTTHWQLTGGGEVEIIAWLDDHSRYLTHLSAHTRANGRTVTDTFQQAASEHGYPAATLTDNGNIFTTRFAGGTFARTGGNAFETLLALHGITQKNGRPYKPTTQGKIERFWQTLKKRLTVRPAATLDELQHELDEFRTHYNQHRPHRSLNRRTPAFAYTLIPKAAPTQPDDPNIWRVRYDTIDAGGKVSLRFANRMMHLGYGRAHARTAVIVLIHGLHATTITPDGEVIAEHIINPNKGYQARE
ncbi:IS481 family transposase [Chryseoglobus sp. 28M-23]|uniref:IS481 family transposase n=1 Tax=Chryseoglobus sp. 28M-23 TaxID=2772253 RepID=UPI0017475BB3|nr:IS481 family transposase [Chryseoglobus sp. 28M-23]QOD93361.1 IS481 family transposase [Chryseoglobus sp. 28M-23]